MRPIYSETDEKLWDCVTLVRYTPVQRVTRYAPINLFPHGGSILSAVAH